MIATCNDGDIRLIHGDTEYDGLVEVCFNQRWGTVNGDGWSSVDAQVVCRQLGYSTEGKYIHTYMLIYIIITLNYTYIVHLRSF